MAKAIPDVTMDPSLDKFATATRMVATSSQPANFAGIAAVALADVTLTGADFTKADDTSGRKVTVGAKNGVTVDSSGTATHVTLDDGSTLLAVTTCTSQALTAGNTVNFPAWKWNIQDPT
jgi:hypothetical protein